MRQLTALLLLLLFSIGLHSQVVQTSAGTGTNQAVAEQEIKTLEQQYAQVYQRSDVAAAERLFAPEYLHTFGVPARTVTRADVLESYRNPAMRGGNIEAFSFDVEKVQSYGNTAVTKGAFKRKSKDNDGRRTDLEGLFTHVWVKGANGWQLVSSHNSPKQSADADKAAEQEIAGYFNRMTEMQRTGDAKQTLAIIDSLYADGFKSLGPTGAFTTKDSIRARNERRLAEVGNLKPFFETARREDLKVDVFGNAAVATSRTIARSIDQAKAGVPPVENRSLAFLVRQNGGWKIVASSVIPIRDAAKDSAQILAIEKEGAELDLRGDNKGIVDYINKYLSDDLIATEGGRNYTKADILKDYMEKKDKPQEKLETLRNEDLQIRVNENAAIVTGRAVLRSAKEAEAKKPLRQQQFTRMYVKQNGVWRIVADHRSPFSEGQGK